MMEIQFDPPQSPTPSSPTTTKASDMMSRLHRPQLIFVNAVISNSFVLIDGSRRQRVDTLFNTLG